MCPYPCDIIEAMHKAWHFHVNLVFTVYHRDMSGKEMEWCMGISAMIVLSAHSCNMIIQQISPVSVTVA